jgi:hypothetical protein
MTGYRSYNFRKENRLCTKCSAPLDLDDKVMCKGCKTLLKAYAAELRKKRRLSGKCVNCGCDSIARVCNDCKPLLSRNVMKWRLKKISLGLCGLCGKLPLATKWICASCNENKSIARRIRWEKFE